MRLSTSNTYSTALDSLVDRQARLAGTQEQMTTGKRVNHASDDGNTDLNVFEPLDHGVPISCRLSGGKLTST